MTSSDEVQLWQLPEVLDEEETRKRELATAAQLENIQQQAYEEAHEKGYQDGLQQSVEELKVIQQKAQQFDQLMSALCEPFETLDEQVVEQMAELSIAIARQLVRRELHLVPGQVVAVVREAMAELPIGSRNVEIHLHPVDAKLVRDALSISEDSDENKSLWRIVEDPAQTRGGCRVTTENSVIDATVETRFNRIITQMLGGERKNDQSTT